MRTVTIMFLLALLVQAHAEEIAANRMSGRQHTKEVAVNHVSDMQHVSDKLVNKLLDSILKLDFKALDDAMLNKPAHLTVGRSTNPLYSMPKVSTSGVAPLLPRALNRQHCGIFCNAHDDKVQPQPVVADSLGRREVGFAAAISGIAAGFTEPNSALAAGKDVAKGFTDAGFEGLKYMDKPLKDNLIATKDNRVGTRDEATKGAEARISYRLQLGSGGNAGMRVRDVEVLKLTLGADRQYAAWDLVILGAGNMPPMRAGGKRSVFIPASLAFGEDGEECAPSAGCPRIDGVPYSVPPNTPILLTIELGSVKSAAAAEADAKAASDSPIGKEFVLR